MCMYLLRGCGILVDVFVELALVVILLQLCEVFAHPALRGVLDYLVTLLLVDDKALLRHALVGADLTARTRTDLELRL